MKILFLLTQDLESPAGVGRYFPWARELVRRGHRVSIAALHSNFASVKDRHYIQDGVEVNYVAQMHVMKKNNQKLYFPAHKLIRIANKATIELLKTAWESNADVIQLGKPHPMNSIPGLILKYVKNKVLFLDCDDFEMANIHFGGSWQKVGVRFFENLMPKHADIVSVHTTFMYKMVTKMGIIPEKLIYLPHGVDHFRFMNVDESKVEEIKRNFSLFGKKIIIYVGSLSLPSHPVDLLLDAFQIIHTVIPDAILLIVGGGEEFDRLVSKSRWLGLEKSVIFSGRVPGSEVARYLKLADVAAEPVIDNQVGRSMLPLKMFEAWAAGVPFVTQDVGDRRMIMGDPPAGLIAEAGNPNSLADVIIKVLSDPNLAQTLRKRGYQQGKEYSWENLGKKMEDAYLNALAAKYGKPN